jgi:hypothetical protein
MIYTRLNSDLFFDLSFHGQIFLFTRFVRGFRGFLCFEGLKTCTSDFSLKVTSSGRSKFYRVNSSDRTTRSSQNEKLPKEIRTFRRNLGLRFCVKRSQLCTLRLQGFFPAPNMRPDPIIERTPAGVLQELASAHVL